jgi:hypothetical protein
MKIFDMFVKKEEVLKEDYATADESHLIGDDL